MNKPFPLWDLPTRLFHWILVLCIAMSWWTGEQEELDRHAWIGYTALVLVSFRLIWGLVGSRHSRFADFLVGPRGVTRYLRGQGSDSVGHNPLGGWSVLLLLLLVFTQAVSGLFNSDDLLFNGPLYYAASVSFRDAMGVVHEWAFNLLLVFIVLHVLAVLFYQFRRRERLLQAMWRGFAAGREGTAPPAPRWLALLITVLLALALWWILASTPQPVSMW